MNLIFESLTILFIEFFLHQSAIIMTLLYYVGVIKGNIIIASYGDSTSASEKDIIKLLPSSQTQEQKITSGKLYSYISTPVLTFFSVSPSSVDKQRVLIFLDTLSRRWVGSFGPVSANATLHSLDTLLLDNFASLFNDFNKPQSKTDEIHRQLNETEQILAESVSKAIDRGEELDSISTKSEQLLSTSEEFRTAATNLKWKMKCSYIKSWVFWIIICILIFYVIVSWFCGGFFLKKCIKNEKK